MADNKVNSGLLEFSEDQKVFVALDAETSEVKKAVTIDGDGVETDIQGVQPTGKKEITSTEEVNVASYATAQVVDEDLVAGNIKKDVDILGVVGSYEGEGGSDFSTATLTVTHVGFVISSLQLVAINDGNLTPSTVDYEGDVEIVLYKGAAIGYIALQNDETAVFSGNIINDMGNLEITGNCAVTITEGK